MFKLFIIRDVESSLIVAVWFLNGERSGYKLVVSIRVLWRGNGEKKWRVTHLQATMIVMLLIKHFWSYVGPDFQRCHRDTADPPLSILVLVLGAQTVDIVSRAVDQSDVFNVRRGGSAHDVAEDQ